MRKKPKSLILPLILVAAALLISGCGKSGSRSTVDTINPYQGIEGVSATFLPESSPKIITAGGSAEALLLISNKGAVDVDESQVIVTVSDTRGLIKFEKPVFNLSEPGIIVNPDTDNPGKLPGKESNGQGSGEGVEVKMTAKGVSSVLDDGIETGIKATVCYRYTTKASANVCIDASRLSFQKERKTCNSDKPVTLTGQGAPVAIKRIETITNRADGKVKPRFKIYIGNVGDGLIIRKDQLGLFCTSPEQGKKGGLPDEKLKLNTVSIEAYLKGKLLTCSEPEKVLSSTYGNDFVLCGYLTDDISVGDGTYATPLDIILEYGYTETSIPVPVVVEKGLDAEQLQKK